MATATLTNGIVHLTTGVWSGEFPVEELDERIAFYRRMFKRYERPSYKETLDALVGVKEG